ncbi:MAG: peptidoglycan DD-metalloendopeptidase family protein [Oscillospiraceae bacterium]|nr:peptidoglycan DD-metalloendopeptidase family protein [Oscillospiraceae bacterium]
MRNRRFVKTVAIVLAVLMVLTTFFTIAGYLFARGTSLTEIDRQISQARSQLNNLEGQAATINAQLTGVQERLAALRADERAYLEEVGVLQEKVILLEDRIALTEEEIAIYQMMILDKELRAADLVAQEEEQLERYRQRVRTMEERGRLSYIQLLLTAQSFSDLMTKISDINQIMEHDQQMAEELARFRDMVREYKADLEEDRVHLEILVAQLERDRAELQAEVEALEELIAILEAQIAANEIEAAELAADYERVAAQILSHAQSLQDLDAARREAIAELERQTAAGGNPGGGGMGGSPSRPGTGHFIWPSDFTNRVTSGFGPRVSPGGIGSTNHRGIDIAAPGIYGTNILAAASGVVTFSGWMGGFGNVVMINHGNGYVTVYAHNSVNLVSRNANVVQGQVIARVGSTGNSTGPHIHFEIIRNGVHVDPMLYFQR